jgi:hypothetical protein
VASRLPPRAISVSEPSPDTQASGSTTSSVSAPQAKTYARTRQGTLVAFSAS